MSIDEYQKLHGRRGHTITFYTPEEMEGYNVSNSLMGHMPRGKTLFIGNYPDPLNPVLEDVLEHEMEHQAVEGAVGVRASRGLDQFPLKYYSLSDFKPALIRAMEMSRGK